METRLLVDASQQSGLRAAVGREGSVQIDLEALGDLVLELELGAERVGGGPTLGEDDTVLLVDVLALEVAGDERRLGVARAANLEGDIGGSVGLDLERGSVDGEVLTEEVVGGLSKVLHVSNDGFVSQTIPFRDGKRATPSRTEELAEGETWRIDYRSDVEGEEGQIYGAFYAPAGPEMREVSTFAPTDATCIIRVSLMSLSAVCFQYFVLSVQRSWLCQ